MSEHGNTPESSRGLGGMLLGRGALLLRAPLTWPQRVGAWFFQVTTLWAEMLALLYFSIKYYFVERGHGRRMVWTVVRKQVLFTAVYGISLMLMIALMMGSLIAVSVNQLFKGLFTQSSLNELIVFIIMRELAPLVVTLVVIARSGTAIATELANLKVNREYNLLLTMGINVEYFIVFPRIVGMVASVFCIMAYFNFTALFGGFVVAKLTVAETIDPFRIITSIAPADITVSLIKSTTFGVIISLVCCYFGLSAKRSFTEVPQVATRGVVNTLVLVFMFDIIISAITVLAFGYPQPQMR